MTTTITMTMTTRQHPFVLFGFALLAACNSGGSTPKGSGGRASIGATDGSGNGGAATNGSGGSATGGAVGTGSGGANNSGGASGTAGGASIGGGNGGMENSAGQTGTSSAGGRAGMGGGGSGAGGGGMGGAVATRVFPSQACLDKASALLAMMTADEKAAQMHQIERTNVTAAEITQYGVGSVYSQGGSGPTPNTATAWADMIDAYRKASFASRLKIPIIYGLDVVHGIGPVKDATVFPHNIGLGASRDLALVEEVAQIVAEESAAVGADFPFAPVVAVARDERWGRTYEAFGETTELASTMGVAYTNGFQKRSGPFTVLGNVKHYLGDGGTAKGVNNGSTTGDETALRAMHLAPYQAAVRAGVGSVMASYSTWQGTRMHANTAMIVGVLKGDLGFGGFVASDYNGCYQQGVNLAGCLKGGIDMYMTFNQTAPGFVSAVKALIPGTIPQSRVDDAARRILVAKCEMGLLDGTLHLADRTLTAKVGSAAHRAVARRAVAASMVVLKNEGGVLPLSKTAPGVAIGGKTGDDVGNQCGGWTVTWQGMTGQVTAGTTVRQAFEGVMPDKVFYALDGSNTGSGAAKVGVAVIGETPYAEGCGDIPAFASSSCVARPSTLALDAADVQVVQKMKQAGLKVVVVLVVGRPLIIDSIMSMADAVVVAWLPGSEGAGITDVLFGDVHPTAKLPHSWPRSMAQIPINVGDPNYDPLFPFGHGLTY